MPFRRRLLTALFALILLLSVPLSAYATEPSDSEAIQREMLRYYLHYQNAAETDILRLLQDLSQIDPALAQAWQDIFEFWYYANDGMDTNITEPPEDLPEDDTLCIVVLGYMLSADGGMQAELFGRLKLALEAANQYPNALIVCTGGGTALDHPNITEADQMRRWLIGQGIDRERIIAENRSYSTNHNAENTLKILREQHPQVTTLLMVTSDYHLPRSTLLFHTEAVLTALEFGTEPLRIGGWLGHEAGHEGFSETYVDQTVHVGRLAGFELGQPDAPVLTQLTGLRIDGETRLEFGEEPVLTVTAIYDCGFTRDVTAICEITPFQPEAEGSQSLTASYSENGVVLSDTVEIVTLPMETDPPPTLPPQPTEAPAPVEEEPEAEPSLLWIPPLVVAVLLLAVLILRTRKK